MALAFQAFSRHFNFAKASKIQQTSTVFRFEQGSFAPIDPPLYGTSFRQMRFQSNKIPARVCKVPSREAWPNLLNSSGLCPTPPASCASLVILHIAIFSQCMPPLLTPACWEILELIP